MIILTAYASDETAIESKRIGVFEYRSKPFNAEKLLDTIENALGAAPVASNENDTEKFGFFAFTLFS